MHDRDVLRLLADVELPVKGALALRTERLAELTTDDLHRVHGAGFSVLDLACVVLPKTVRGCTTADTCP